MNIYIDPFYIPLIILWIIAIGLMIKASMGHYTDMIIWFLGTLFTSVITGLYFLGSYLK